MLESSGFYKKKFSSNKISSLYFMAPERIYGELSQEKLGLATKADIWAVGVLIYVLIYGKVPFEGETYSHLVKSIRKGKLKD